MIRDQSDLYGIDYEMSFEEFSKKVDLKLPHVLTSIKQKPMRFLARVGRIVREQYLEGGWKFQDISSESKKTFTPEQDSYFKTVLKNIISKEDKKQIIEWKKSAQSLFDKLLEETTVNMTRSHSNQPVIAILSELQIDSRMKQILQPKPLSDLECDVFGPLLRFVQKLIGELDFKLQQMNIEDKSNYVVELPDAVRKIIQHETKMREAQQTSKQLVSKIEEMIDSGTATVETLREILELLNLEDSPIIPQFEGKTIRKDSRFNLMCFFFFLSLFGFSGFA